ncbi:unknown protein [Seminavis robusta]|uniref:DDE Tnp4 domain-containing protein n=1 Tax=Seminavis robusta TaxID=568900 RepID=A0A9N8E079_9STRA|nr:unknown protein [Seminavis robusta]|eukprot:Sro407_g136530.1 n/a (318) ;mRNA; r:4961-5914
MAQNLPANEVLETGLRVIGFEQHRIDSVNEKKNLSRFRTHYASSPIVLSIVWDMLLTSENEDASVLPDVANFQHFLMAVNFLACYPTENEGEARFGVSDKTYRKWNWFYVKKLAALKPEVIVWPNAWNNPNNQHDPNTETTFIISVDGVHCMIQEPTLDSFSENKQYYSHKFKKPAFDYEVALSIFTNKCVWIAGPYPASKHDISIFRSSLKGHMEQNSPGKLAIGDKGYRGEPALISTPSSHDNQDLRDFKGRAMSRQETFNCRLKNFAVMDVRFRHGHDRATVDDTAVKHQACFFACAVLVQVDMDNGGPLFYVA